MLPSPATAEQQQRYKTRVRHINYLQRFASTIRSCELLAVLVAETKHRGREGCLALRYSSEDGSHRAIAMALAGYDTIDAWIGNPGT